MSVTALTLRGIDLIAAGRTLRVDMDSSLTGSDRLAVTRFDAKSDTSDLGATGEFSSLSARTGKFAVDAQSLDVDGLLAFIAATTPAGSQAASPAPAGAPRKLTIGLKAKKGIAAGAGFSNLSATCRVEGDNARLDDLSLNAFDGTFKGVVGLKGSGAEPQFSWRGTFEGLDAAKVAAFAGTTGSVTGKLDGSVDITAAGQDPAAALHRAHGRARVVLSDGKLPGLEIVRGVILAFGKPTGDRPAGSGEAFSQLAATMAVADQRLTTNDLTFASRDFDMTARGALSLASQTLNFQADVILSRELSAQAGRDLYRLAREDDRIILPARITGTCWLTRGVHRHRRSAQARASQPGRGSTEVAVRLFSKEGHTLSPERLQRIDPRDPSRGDERRDDPGRQNEAHTRRRVDPRSRRNLGKHTRQ